jgi:hypothetical protein
MLHNSCRLPLSDRYSRLGRPWSDRRTSSGTTQSACPNRIHTAEVVGSSPAAPTLFSQVSELRFLVGHGVRLRRARHARDRNSALWRIRFGTKSPDEDAYPDPLGLQRGDVVGLG